MSIISYGCHKNVPHTQWPNMVEVYPLIVLEARDAKKSRHQNCNPYKDSRWDSSLASSSSGGSRGSMACGGITLVSDSVFSPGSSSVSFPHPLPFGG